MTFQPAKHYSREEIRDVLGGGIEEYLPTSHGKVVCGAFRADGNPDAPMVILPGFGPKREKSAELFNSQGTAIPVFLKRAANQWQYVGDFRVKRLSRDPVEIAEHAARANRQNDVSMVLFLERSPRDTAA
jgi:hypothetical protein